MKKHSWGIIVLLLIIWAIFIKMWIGDDQKNFKFSNRENETVFPTPLTRPIDSVDAPISSPSSTVPPSSTSSSVIRY